ncbi:hypothetical protein KCP74_14135 [Salmonella enterica subsp. enterica]|nr:hypothetical protein KCP74_14135 [Salmonella enterica subsp. enterica]
MLTQGKPVLLNAVNSVFRDLPRRASVPGTSFLRRYPGGRGLKYMTAKARAPRRNPGSNPLSFDSDGMLLTAYARWKPSSRQGIIRYHAWAICTPWAWGK